MKFPPPCVEKNTEEETWESVSLKMKQGSIDIQFETEPKSHGANMQWETWFWQKVVIIIIIPIRLALGEPS